MLSSVLVRQQHTHLSPSLFFDSGCIPLGLVVYLICVFMLVYSILLCILVFEASGYSISSPSSSSYSVPIALFALFFLISIAVALFGFIVLTITSLKTTTRNSRLGSILFRIFHLLFLSVSFLTTGSMFFWLKLNVDQTGRWDHMRLPPYDTKGGDTSSLIPDMALLSFQSLLKPAGPSYTSDEWLIYPAVWISVFVVVLIAQIYSWICLVAYIRRVDERAHWKRGSTTKRRSRELEDWRYDYEAKPVV
jgi:heme/copper-type cytochrome/quinol oxidase subunit 2